MVLIFFSPSNQTFPRIIRYGVHGFIDQDMHTDASQLSNLLARIILICVKPKQNPLYHFLFSYIFNAGKYTLIVVIAMTFGAFNSVLKEYLKRPRTIKIPSDINRGQREATIFNTYYYWQCNWRLARKISAVALGSEHQEIPVFLSRQILLVLFQLVDFSPTSPKDRHIMKQQTTYLIRTLKISCLSWGLQLQLWIPSSKIHNSLNVSSFGISLYIFMHKNSLMQWHSPFLCST